MPGNVDRIRVLTIAITAPQHEQSIAGRFLRGGVKRLGSNFGKRCSKPIRPLAIGVQEAEIARAAKALGQQVLENQPEEIGAGERALLHLVRLCAAIAEAHPAIPAGEDGLFTDDAAVEVATEGNQGLLAITHRLAVRHPLPRSVKAPGVPWNCRSFWLKRCTVCQAQRIRRAKTTSACAAASPRNSAGSVKVSRK
jgi:hypothetical protein